LQNDKIIILQKKTALKLDHQFAKKNCIKIGWKIQKLKF
jgi:hypothetical protein